MSINERIRLIRKESGLNQAEFSQKLGVSQGGVSWMEKSGNNVSDQSKKMICSIFNVSEEWLETGSGDMYIKNDDYLFNEFSQKYQLSPAEQEVARYCLSLTSDQRSEILKHILQVAEIIKTVSPEEKPSSIVEEFPPANILSNQNTTKVKPATRKVSTEMKEAILNAELTDEKRVKMS